MYDSVYIKVHMNYLIGFTGGMCSGKDSWANLISDEFDYVHRSTSQITRDYIKYHGLGEPTRDLTRETSTFLRVKYGKDYLVERILQEEINAPKLVISGLYVPEEVNALKRAGGLLVAVVAESETRFARMNRRKRNGEVGSIDHFNRLDSDDMFSKQTDQRLELVIDEADLQIDGNIPIADTSRCLPIAKEIIKKVVKIL